MLLHHFGTKDQPLVQLLNGVRDRLSAVGDAADGGGRPRRLEPIWQWTSAPEHDSLFRLFFEAYGIALQAPDTYREFLGGVVQDWLDELAPEMGAQRATLPIATVRGPLLDVLTTGERARVDSALPLLDALLMPAGEPPSPRWTTRRTRRDRGIHTGSGSDSFTARALSHLLACG